MALLVTTPSHPLAAWACRNRKRIAKGDSAVTDVVDAHVVQPDLRAGNEPRIAGLGRQSREHVHRGRRQVDGARSRLPVDDADFRLGQYRAVVVTIRWPSRSPIIGSPSPSARAREANVCRRSRGGRNFWRRVHISLEAIRNSHGSGLHRIPPKVCVARGRLDLRMIARLPTLDADRAPHATG